MFTKTLSLTHIEYVLVIFFSLLSFVFLLSYFADLQIYWIANEQTVLYLGFLSACLAFLIFNLRSERPEAIYAKVMPTIIPHLFLITLLALLIADFTTLPPKEYLIPLSIVFGILFFHNAKVEYRITKPLVWNGINFQNTAIVILLVVFLFSNILFSQNQSINVDEAILYIAAENILDSGLPLLDGGQVYTRGYIYTYPLAIIYVIFGVSEFTTKLISIVATFATIGVLYFLARKLTGNHLAAFVATSSVALLPLLFQFGSFARMYSLNLLIELLILWHLLEYSRGKNMKNILIVCFLFILGFMSHNLFVFSLIPACLTLTYLSRDELILWVKKRKIVAISIGIVCLVSTPIFLLYLINSTKIDILSNLQYTGALIDILFNQYSYLALPTILFVAGSIGLLIKAIRKGQITSVSRDLLILIFNIAVPLLLIEIFIYANFPTYRIRYIYHFLPAIVMIGVLFLLSVKKMRWMAYLAIPAVMMTFLLNINYAQFENRPIVNYEQIKNIQLNSEDVIISNNPSVTKYYLGSVDYWLMRHPGEIELYSYKDQTRSYNVYTGSQLVSNITDLEPLLSTKHGYVILDPSFNRFMGREIMELLTKDLQQSSQEISILKF